MSRRSAEAVLRARMRAARIVFLAPTVDASAVEPGCACDFVGRMRPCLHCRAVAAPTEDRSSVAEVAQ